MMHNWKLSISNFDAELEGRVIRAPTVIIGCRVADALLVLFGYCLAVQNGGLVGMRG